MCIIKNKLNVISGWFLTIGVSCHLEFYGGNMEKRLVVISALLLAFMGAEANAESFVGGAVGVASYPDFVASDTTAVANLVAAANPGTPIVATGVQDKTGTGLKLFGGTWINNNFGAEVGYVDFGKPSETIATTGVATTWTAKVTASAFYGAILGGVKVNDKTRIFGKLGVYSSSATTTYSVIGPGGTAGLSQSASNTGAMFGIGSSYQFSQTIGMRLEFEHYGQIKINDYSKADINLLSLGLAYTF